MAKKKAAAKAAAGGFLADPPRYHRYREMAREGLVRWLAHVRGVVEALHDSAGAVARELGDPASPLYELVDPDRVRELGAGLLDLAGRAADIVPPVRLDLPDPAALATDYRRGGMG